MIYVLDKDLIAQSILSNAGPDMCPYFDDYLRETIAGGSVLYEFECPANHEAAGHLSSDGYLIRPDLNGELILLKIRTVEERKTSDGALLKVVFAESAALELIHDILRPVSLTAVTAAQAVGEVLEGTNWQVGTVEWLGVENFEFDSYPTVLSALHEINERYGGDIVFRPEFVNGEVTGRYVDLLQHRGSEGVFRFDNTTDIQEVERVEDSSLLVTALIGVGKSNDAGVPLTFAGLSDTLYLKDGTPVDKPLGLDWVGNPEALQIFSSNGKHKLGVFKTEETDAQALLKRTWAELLKYSEPQLSYAVRVALLARSLSAEYVHKTVTIGDSGDVIDHEFDPPLLVSARVIERVTSFTDPEKDSVVLGNFIRYEKDPIQIIENLQDTIRTESGKWEQGGSGEMIFKSPDPPENPLDDALWLDTGSTPEVLKRWDGAVWQKASPTAAADIGAETPQGAQEKADAAIETAAGDATEKAGAAEQNAKEYADAQDLIIADNMSDFVAENYEKKITQSSEPPVAPVTGDLWIDTSVTPYIWKRYTGTEWVNAIVVTSDLIVTSGLDAGVIKFGVMSGERILADSLDANRLKAGSVIADDITFTGTLDGADGTFSGHILVGPEFGEPGHVIIANGSVTSELSMLDGSMLSLNQSVEMASGEIKFMFDDWINDVHSTSLLTQEGWGMTLYGNFQVMGDFQMYQNLFSSTTVRLAPYGPVIFAESGDPNGIVIMERPLDFYGEEATFYGALTVQSGYAATFNGPTTFGNTTTFNWTTTFNHTSNFAAGRSVNFEGTNYLDGTNYVNGPLYLYNSTLRNYGSEFKTNQVETGFMGIGGMTALNTSATGASSGVGVNFRMKKTYVPSSVTISATSTNVPFSTHALVIDITVDGFWFYIYAGQANVNAYRYWRGYYTA